MSKPFRIITSSREVVVDVDQLVGLEVYTTSNVMQADCKFTALVKMSRSKDWSVHSGRSVVLLHNGVVRREYSAPMPS